jgi:hypothetical protein
MAIEPASQSNTAIAQRTQERFDAYLLGLIFTILGLSIQTAKLGTSPTADAFEVISWVLFLVAGLTGLSRFEGTSEVYRLYGIQDEKEEAKRALQKAKLEGLKEVFVAPLKKFIPVDQYIAEASQSVATVKGVVEPLVQRSGKKYRVMKYGFAAGLLALMVARAWEPIHGIVHAWTTP